MKLSGAFDLRSNALNAIRLSLALTVLAVHSWHLTGHVEPHLGSLRAHEMAVDGFFVLSGFLIAGAIGRASSVRRFLWHRALRIMPGYWVCLALTASAVAFTTGAWADAAWYVSRNFALVQEQWGIGDVWVGNPHPSSVNGSLWSLQYEAGCYLTVAILAAVGLAKRTAILPTAVAVIGLTWLMLAIDPSSLSARLGLCFAIGVTALCLAHRIALHPWWAAAATLLLAASSWLPAYQLSGAVPLAYLLLYAGARWRCRVGADRDLSYGVYIYAFPVQQLLAGAGIQQVALMLCLSVLAVVPLALLSQRYVEAPALRLRGATVAWPSPPSRPLGAVPGPRAPQAASSVHSPG